MIRQDYILRMIEQAAQMVAKLTQSNVAGTEARVKAASEELARHVLGLGLNEIYGKDDATLMHRLRGTALPFPVGLGATVQLLLVQSEVFQRAGNNTMANELRGRAVGLLLRGKLSEHAGDLPEFAPSLEGLLTEHSDDQLPVATVALLVCYHEQRGEFAAAEDTLFRLQERIGNDADIRELGESFYQRLLRQTDETLSAGNLPRTEVEQGEEEWVKLFS